MASRDLGDDDNGHKNNALDAIWDGEVCAMMMAMMMVMTKILAMTMMMTMMFCKLPISV